MPALEKQVANLCGDRPAWSTSRVPGWPGLGREPVSKPQPVT